ARFARRHHVNRQENPGKLRPPRIEAGSAGAGRGRIIMSIRIESVRKHVGTLEALARVNLDIPSGELVAVQGPSGSCNLTLLRILAGLEVPDSGRILLEGRDTTRDPVRERQVGFVFQHYALFRHLTIFENVAYGLRVKPKSQRPHKEYIRSRVDELLKL